MIKNIHILSLSCLFMLPPLFPAAGAFGRKMPDMAKGFKKSLFDKETREACERKMKEPRDIKNMKIEHNGWVTGEAAYIGVHMLFASAVSWVGGQALSGARTAVNDTRDFIAAKSAGGAKGLAANLVEQGITKGVPIAYMAGVHAAAEAGTALEGVVTMGHSFNKGVSGTGAISGFAGPVASSTTNPYMSPAPTSLPTLTGPGTTASANHRMPWVSAQQVTGGAKLLAKTAPQTVAYSGYTSTPDQRANMEVVYNNAHAKYVQPFSDWNNSTEAAFGAVVVAGVAAANGMSSVGILAAVEATAQAARAAGYAMWWLP